MTQYADIEAISNHIERCIGPIKTVFHEIVSDDLHIDIHHVKSSFFRRHEVLITSGMSAVPMDVPDGVKTRLAEVLIVLPKGWPLDMSSLKEDRHYWPIKLLKDVARFPQAMNSWIGFGHTIGNGSGNNDVTPYAPGLPFCGAAILPPMSFGKVFTLQRKDRETIYFWAVVPLHRPEMEFAFERGTDPLLDMFDKAGVTEKVDMDRMSVVG